MDVPVRDEVFCYARRLGQLLGPVNHQYWCKLGIVNNAKRVVCGDHLVYSFPRWPTNECICGRNSSTYAYNKGEGYEQFIRTALNHLDIMSVPVTCDANWHRTQKDIKSKFGARSFARGQYLNSVQDTPGEGIVTPQEEEEQFSKSKNRKHVRIDESSPEVSSFPTDAAERAKELKEAREAAILAAGGTQEDIKKSRKRKAQTQEKHFDDCGSDVELLRDEEERALLALSHPVSYSFYDSTRVPKLAPDMFLNLDSTPAPVDHVEGETLTAFLVRHAHRKLDVMEICGGAGGVSKVSLRHHLKVGHNFDLNHGIDLTNPDDVRGLWNYVRFTRPRFIVMGPPCTAFGNLSRVNRVHHPTTWAQSLVIGKQIAKLC